jgi:3-hydroxyisobutyrate dehydrogenase-like beta-hydroxyacid dehydrogenase
MLGFIGLGYMGSRMARRLLQAGYAIGVYNRTAEKARPLADFGARVYSAAAHLAREADVVFSTLTDDDAVEKVMIDPEGVLAGAHHGLTIVDLSSVHPATSRRVASAAALRDVPISTHGCLGALSRQRRGAW